MYNEVCNKVAEQVISIWEMSEEELFSMDRSHRFSSARHMMWQKLNELGMPVNEITDWTSFKARKKLNHGVISLGISAGKEKLKTNPLYRQAYKSINVKP
jgi:hypothetical protein